MTKKGGRPSKQEIQERREKVRELLLKGKSKYQIAKITGSNRNTIDKDIKHVQARYTRMVMNNPHLAEKQFERVERLLDEVTEVKKEYWELFEEIQERVKEGKKQKKEWQKQVDSAKQRLEEAKESGNKKELREARKELDDVIRPPRIPTYVTTRIDALKAILDRVDKESKLLNLFSPDELINKNYVSIDTMKSIMEVFKSIIMDLIPEDRRNYAFKRLKTIDITTLGGNDVVDAEVFDEKPDKR